MEQHADGLNEERLTREFISLAEIASPSFRERQIADYLKHRLAGFGLEVTEDETGGRIGGDAGNVYACLPGDKNRAAFFLCAHMDTVNPANGVKVMFQDGVFRSEGSTVLGGDDKARHCGDHRGAGDAALAAGATRRPGDTLHGGRGAWPAGKQALRL